jgi:hypothetical protein
VTIPTTGVELQYSASVSVTVVTRSVCCYRIATTGFVENTSRKIISDERRLGLGASNPWINNLWSQKERERVRKDSRRVEEKRKHLGESERRFISEGGKRTSC